MNPTWDLLPFNQLCRTLARKTGQAADSYSGCSRDWIKTQLEQYEDSGSVLVNNVTSLDEDQLTRLKADLTQLVHEEAYNERIGINGRFADLRAEILAAIAASRQTKTETVVVNIANGTENNVGRQHKDFADLLSFIATKQNVFLVGPAGSGKTSAAMKAAEALGVPFFFNGAIDNEYKLLGFIDAQGRVISPAFRKAWCGGGLYLYDELDASLPSAALCFNAALSNDMCDFPDGCMMRHPDFYCMAAGNTYYGADHHYVGRMKQDGAFLDRFLVMDWHYDLDLEKDLGVDLWPEGTERALAWNKMVVKTREQAALKGLQVIISPRATLGGIKLLRSGISWDAAVRVTLRKTMKASDWDKIMEFTEEPRAALPRAIPEPPELPYGYKAPAPAETAVRETYNQYFKVNSHGKTHRKFYKDLI